MFAAWERKREAPALLTCNNLLTAKVFRILYEPLESWNVIGKCWLRKLDIKFNDNIFYVNAQMYQF